MEQSKFVGIDVSKERLDVAVVPSEEVRSFGNDESGCKALVTWLASIGPALIVLEATGGFEMLPTSSLSAAGLPVVIVNPRQVRNFAKAMGKLAKTDAIDSLAGP